MEDKRKELKDMNVLLSGLAITSRTETLEDYLKDKVKSLTVIAISSCFLKENFSVCRFYEEGRLKKEFKIPNFRIKDSRGFRYSLVSIFFLLNWLVMSLVILRMKKRYDLGIGISQSFALWVAALRKLKIVRYFIYYCGDYYIPDSKVAFNSIFLKFISLVDCFTVRNADYVWDVSSKIAEYREKIGKVKKGSYNNAIVPLGYSNHLRRFVPIEEINRWEIGFVGTVTASQGLQLLVEALPGLIKKIPQLKVRIIGQGPYSQELKEMVSKRGVESYFIFPGFIKEEERMLQMLSHSAIGVALWSDSIEDKNIICADTGKNKLYAFCGLPAVVTKACSTHDIITKAGAGIAIEYKVKDLENALFDILSDDDRLKEFKRDAYNLGDTYVSDNIFQKTFQQLNFNIR